LKRQCEKCGTIWTIHKLGNITATEGLLKTEARECTGEYCPGCMAWLFVREENTIVHSINDDFEYSIPYSKFF